MKIFDIHAHIYPDAIATKATQAVSVFYNEQPMFGDGRLSIYQAAAEKAGVTRSAIHSVATTPHQVASVNRFIMATAKAQPDRMLPFATLHPDLENLGETVDALIAQGFKGIKLHPEFQKFNVDEPRMLRLFDLLAGRLPVLLHCGDYRCDNSDPARIRHLLKEIPNLTLICAHLGGWTTWEKAAAELTGADVWVDTSSALYALEPARAAQIIRGYGVERTLFGSDYPMWSPADEAERLMRLPLTDGEREKILWTNHLSLFGGENTAEN